MHACLCTYVVAWKEKRLTVSDWAIKYEESILERYKLSMDIWEDVSRLWRGKVGG